ncbi:MAG: STAS/SEC14 domain-containing protein [Gemmatimonadales bacterium]|nr:MAG: STAS/SEC14 domain-containing protein [Gemmatimonadales bacterium]
MYQALARSSGNVLGYRCSDQITGAEVREIHREIRDAIEEHGQVRFLIHIGDLDLPTAKAVWEDLRLLPVYVADVERYAIVGDAKWQEWLSGITDRLTRGEAQHFPADRLDEAWDWVRES